MTWSKNHATNRNKWQIFLSSLFAEYDGLYPFPLNDKWWQYVLSFYQIDRNRPKARFPHLSFIAADRCSHLFCLSPISNSSTESTFLFVCFSYESMTGRKLIKTSSNNWSSDESYKDEALCRERMSRQFFLKVSDAGVVRHGFHGCRIKVSFKWRHSEASLWLWLFFLFFFFWACFHGTFTVLSLFGS